MYIYIYIHTNIYIYTCRTEHENAYRKRNSIMTAEYIGTNSRSSNPAAEIVQEACR